MAADWDPQASMAAERSSLQCCHISRPSLGRGSQPGTSGIEANQATEQSQPAVEARYRGILPIEVEVSPLSRRRDRSRGPRPKI